MIKENDVRLGNWVEVFLTKEPMKIDWLAMKHLSDGNVQAAFYDNRPVYVPIPLTKDILLKCGFEDYENLDNDYTVYGNHGDDSDFFLEVDWRRVESGYSPMIKSVEYETIGSNIIYLHQLQNIYYALTNKELSINILSK